MGNVRRNRSKTRWPLGWVPYTVNGPISDVGRQQIDAAMASWSSLAPVRFVPRFDHTDYIEFNVANDECSSSIGRVGGRQLLGCEYPIVAVVAAGTGLRFDRQGDEQVDTLFIGTDGAVYVMWTVGPAAWASPVALTKPGLAPPGAPVTLHHEGGPGQLDAMFVDNNGVVNVMWAVGSGIWEGPQGLTPPGTAPAGAPIALEYQASEQQLDAMFVDVNGAVNVMWIVRGEKWHAPVPLTPVGTAPAGAPIALHHNGGIDQLDAMFVDGNGIVHVMWAVGGGDWERPRPLTPPGTAPAAAPIALHHNGGPGQLDAMFVNGNGVVNVMWSLNRGDWQGPKSLTPINTAAAATPISFEYQGGEHQLDAMFVDRNGVVNVMWSVDRGTWQGPQQLTPMGTAPMAAPVGIAAHPGDVLEAFVVSGANVPSTISARGLGEWSKVSQIGTGYGGSAITHELGHALGLDHEHQRHDRDDFITYHAANVQAGQQHNFDIETQSQPIGKYDYRSIMHYSAGAFSAPGMGPTLTTSNGVVFGNAVTPSTEDAQVMRYIYGQVAQSGTAVACEFQGSTGQLTVVFADGFGGLSVMWIVEGENWEPPVQLALSTFTPPVGAPVSLHHHGSMHQLDAMYVAADGAVNVMWIADDGVWQGPSGLTQPGLAPPGGHVSLEYQGSEGQLDALFVDGNGIVNVLWSVDGGDWQGPQAITPPGTAPAAASISLEYQASEHQLDALFVDANGIVNVMWSVDGGNWDGLAHLTPPNTAHPGSKVALHHQGSTHQLDALFVDPYGVVNVMWAIDGGTWQGPAGIS